jgi:hypothetical protein
VSRMIRGKGAVMSTCMLRVSRMIRGNSGRHPDCMLIACLIRWAPSQMIHGNNGRHQHRHTDELTRTLKRGSVGRRDAQHSFRNVCAPAPLLALGWL